MIRRGSVIRRGSSPRRAPGSRSSSPSETTSLPARTTVAPRASACSATTSIAAALSSTRYISASTRSSSARRASRRARLRETWTTSASRCPVGAGPAVKTGGAAARSGSIGRRREPAETIGSRRSRRSPSRSAPPVSTTRSETRTRYAFKPARMSWRTVHDEIRASTAIGGIAAPLPSKTTTSGSSRAASARALDHVRQRTVRRPCRRLPGGSRPRARRRARRARGGPTPHAARRASGEELVDRRRRSTSSGSAGPPRPIATTTTRRSRASSRATCPVTAVLPTRLPDPITAIDGRSNALERRRIEAEVRADVRSPSASARDAQSDPLARPEHRLVGQVDATSTSTASSESTSGTP